MLEYCWRILLEESNNRRTSRRLAQQIKVESDTLDMKWKQLGEKSQRWYKIVEEALNKFMQFDKAVQACDLNLLKSENSRRAWKPVKDVQLDDLPNQMARANVRFSVTSVQFKYFTIQSFQHRLVSVRAYVDDVNDQCSRLLADNVQLSVEATRSLDSLNQRYKALDTAVAMRIQVRGE